MHFFFLIFFCSTFSTIDEVDFQSYFSKKKIVMNEKQICVYIWPSEQYTVMPKINNKFLILHPLETTKIVNETKKKNEK